MGLLVNSRVCEGLPTNTKRMLNTLTRFSLLILADSYFRIDSLRERRLVAEEALDWVTEFG